MSPAFPAKADAASGGRVNNVLFIDDDPIIHPVIKAILNGKASVTSCLTAGEAICAARASRFDMALVDVNLGIGMSGHELIEHLRELDPLLTTVVVTGILTNNVILDSLRAHTFDFIPKSPGMERHLAQIVGRAADRTHELRSLVSRAEAAAKMKSAVEGVLVENELGEAQRDMQRIFLAKSAASLSALTGSVEAVAEALAQRSRAPKGGDRTKILARESLCRVHDFAGSIRTFLAAPELSIGTVNDLIACAVGVFNAEPSDLRDGREIRSSELNPNQSLGDASSALFRAVVVLLRMALRSAPGGASVVLKPSVMTNPAVELAALRRNGHARVLTDTEFRKGDGAALSIEITTPCRPVTFQSLEAALRDDRVNETPSLVEAAILVCRHMKSALAVELTPPGSTRFTVITSFGS
jgi:DNA-binding NarL/FixJ family response regulator